MAGARVSVRYRVVESGPRTSKSRRTIAVAPAVTEALQVHRRRQLEERLAWGPAWADSVLVFTREDGTGYHPEYLTRTFGAVTKRAGLPPIAFHALRHGRLTTGLRTGVPLLVMSRRLGHSSVQVTGDIHSHVVEELDGDAAELTADLVHPPAVGR